MIKKPGFLTPGGVVGLLFCVLQAGCASTPSTPACPANTQNLPDCPPLSAVIDSEIERIYEYRTWVSPRKLEEDPVAFGVNADIPIQGAQAKILGPDDEGAIDSLAAKLWMIENAEDRKSVV